MSNTWAVLGVALLSLLLVSLESGVVFPVLQGIAADFKADPAAVGWVPKAYALAVAASLVVAGKLGDQFGRRRLLWAGLAVFGIASAGAGAAGDTGWLIGFRALQGIGAAMVVPATLSLTLAAFPRGRRGTAVGLWAAVAAVALAGSVALGGFLVDQLDWRWFFYLGAPAAALAILLAFRFVPGNTPRAVRRFDVPGILTLTGGTAALTLGLIEGHGAGWSSPLIIGLFVLAATQLAAFAFVERRQPDPLVDVGSFRQRNFAVGLLVTFLASTAVFGAFFLLALYLQQIAGYSSVDAGVGLVPLALSVLIGAPLAGRLAGRTDRRWLAAAGFVLVGGGLWWLSVLDPGATWTDLAAPSVLFGLGAALLWPAITLATMDRVPADGYGAGSGVYGAARQIGGVLGVALAASIFVTQVPDQVTDALADAAQADIEEGEKDRSGLIGEAARAQDARTGPGAEINLLSLDRPGSGLVSIDGKDDLATPGANLIDEQLIGLLAQQQNTGAVRIPSDIRGGELSRADRERLQEQLAEQEERAQAAAEQLQNDVEDAIDRGLVDSTARGFQWLSLFAFLGLLGTPYLRRDRPGRGSDTVV